MTLRQKLILTVVISGALYAGYRSLSAAEEAKHRERLRVVDSLTVVARTQMASADSLAQIAIAVRERYEKDTSRARVWRTRWDTVRAGIDTQWLRDTTPVPVAVVHAALQTADSTIRVCGVALTRCDSLQGLQGARADSLRGAALTWEVAAKAATAVRRPLWKRIALKAAEWIAVGRAARALPR